MLNPPVNFDVSADMFADASRRAAAEQLPVTELIDCAEKLKALGQPQRVAELYKTWVAFNSAHPLLYAMYFNYGMALNEVGDRISAAHVMRESIRLKPDFYRAYINAGRIFEDAGHAGMAVTQWLSLVDSLPVVNGESVSHKLGAYKQIGRVLETNLRDAPAEEALWRSLEIDNDQPDVIQHWIALRQRQCKWPVFVESEFVKKSRLVAGISPLSLANYADDPMFQLANAYRYNRQGIGLPSRRPWRHMPPAQAKSGKLRIGYVSSDLREHAVGFSMTDVIETHDRTDFEIFAYYCGINRTDATQARVKAAADQWRDLNGLDDEQAALRIREDGIDILVDLNGYTKDARTKVFALRPAPINVNWFGFPGTMGSPYHHYIIADDYIIPPQIGELSTRRRCCGCPATSRTTASASSRLSR